MYSGPLRAALTALLAVGVATAATGCSSSDSSAAAENGKLDVVAAFYPLQYVTQQVGGDRVSVTNLVSPGTEPHDVELNPKQVAEVTDADAVVYLRNFQPAVDDAVDGGAKDKSLDVASVEPLKDGYVPLEEGELHEDEKGKDPHVWLDPTRLAGIADAVAKKLGDVDPDHASEYTANAKALDTKLTALDGEYQKGLTSCQEKTIVVSHNAFGYLAARYGLTQVAITGLTPEEEPSAARLAEVANYAKQNGVKEIFFETLVSPKIAEALAAEVGAKAEVLDPIEGIEKDSSDDYFSVMRTNLTTLRGALQCQ
ncbi:metal ABC transporter solute-binding protein, Zn/Mn family [Cryptosporangium sp. NPDC048952]|uniref:metal ABC transporter solute-binding protein, Zn/Mn family n=1 Tax=Cryptosporangium sp. NPDC048952 TaxID=3363961 RepID=UPI00371D8E7F